MYYDCVSVHYTGGSCNYLTVNNGTLLTDTLEVYSKLPDDNYLETALVLDDNGIVRLEGIAGSNNTNPSLNTPREVILKGNGTLDDYIEVHSTFNESIDGENYQAVNNHDWIFTIQNQTLTINNIDGSIANSFPFKDILFNQTGVYDQSTNKSIAFGNNYNKSLIHHPYVFQIDEYLPVMRIYDQNKTLLYEYSILPK
jgi:hypothetical protein